MKEFCHIKSAALVKLQPFARTMPSCRELQLVRCGLKSPTVIRSRSVLVKRSPHPATFSKLPNFRDSPAFLWLVFGNYPTANCHNRYVSFSCNLKSESGLGCFMQPHTA